MNDRVLKNRFGASGVHVSLKIYFNDPASKFQKLEFGCDSTFMQVKVK